MKIAIKIILLSIKTLIHSKINYIKKSSHKKVNMIDIEYIKGIATEVGESLSSYRGNIEKSDLKFKNDRDIVSIYDEKTEQFIIKSILKKYPEHNIFGEETGRTSKKSEYCWVIDPIDGTTSFVHGQPFYSISIALMKNNEIIFGLIYAPRLSEMFWAKKGQGAYLNNKKIYVSKRKKLIDSVLSTGFACLRAGLKKNNLELFVEIAPKLRGIRRFGSAALDLAYVSCGYLDGFWEQQLQLYDVAAGVLLVKEAGGEVCDYEGGNNYPKNGIIAGNQNITKILKTHTLNFYNES